MWVVGIDEAGYGPNLGPLVQAAVGLYLPDDDGAALEHHLRTEDGDEILAELPHGAVVIAADLIATVDALRAAHAALSSDSDPAAIDRAALITSRLGSLVRPGQPILPATGPGTPFPGLLPATDACQTPRKITASMTEIQITRTRSRFIGVASQLLGP